MKKDDVIRMAREAGFDLDMWQLSLGCNATGTHEELERFAALAYNAGLERAAQEVEHVLYGKDGCTKAYTGYPRTEGRERMTDRELLEYAAKAEGTVQWIEEAGGWCTMEPDGLWACSAWEPLDDDGDALQLAVKFLFEIDMGRGCIAIRHASGIKVLEAFNNDPYAATRRAIVRAAAEIGRSME